MICGETFGHMGSQDAQGKMKPCFPTNVSPKMVSGDIWPLIFCRAMVRHGLMAQIVNNQRTKHQMIRTCPRHLILSTLICIDVGSSTSRYKRGACFRKSH